MRKLTFEYVKQFFKENNCELLEEKYIGTHVPMKYKCSCGNISKIRFHCFKIGQRCQKCGGREKLTYKFVKDYFKEHGYELLEKEYINNCVKMRYKCICGSIAKTNFANFKKHKKCKKCIAENSSKKQRFPFEYVQNYFKEHGCELLEKEYKNALILLRYRCNCGNIHKITFSSFKKGKRCKKCGYEKLKEKLRFSFNYVKDYFKEHGCELIEQKYKDSRTKMTYICSCGNISKISFDKFKSGQRCARCGGREKLTFNYVYNFFKENNCELLETEYKNCGFKMRYRCSCGEISRICFGNFKIGKRCKKCASKRNSGKNNHSYNPNITDEERKQRKIRTSDSRYKRWRTKVFKRDDYTCQKCFKGGVLRGHHIENWSSNKKLRYVVSNGITLCEDCHVEFHKIYTKKNNNKIQLDEFLFI